MNKKSLAGLARAPRHDRWTRHRWLPVALAAAAFTLACGGGGSMDADVSPTANAPEDRSASAASAGVLYALTPVTGLVGQALLAQGWREVQGLPPEGQPDAVVYVDSSHERANDPEVVRQVTQRGGALLIDSTEHSHGHLLVTSTDGSEAQFASLQEAGDTTLKPHANLTMVKGIESAVVRFQFALGLNSAAEGTAVLVGPTSVRPIQMLRDGRVDNLPADEGLAEALNPATLQAGWHDVDRVGPARFIGFMRAFPDVDIVGRTGGHDMRARLKAWSGCENNCIDLVFGAAVAQAKREGTRASLEMVQGAPAGFRRLPAPIDSLTPTGAKFGPIVQSFEAGLAVFPAGLNPPAIEYKSVGPSNLVDPAQTETAYAAAMADPARLLESSVGEFPFESLGCQTRTVSARCPSSIATKQFTTEWAPEVTFDNARLSSSTRMTRRSNTYPTSVGGRSSSSDARMVLQRMPLSAYGAGAVLSHAASWRAPNQMPSKEWLRAGGSLLIVGTLRLNAEDVHYTYKEKVCLALMCYWWSPRSAIVRNSYSVAGMQWVRFDPNIYNRRGIVPLSNPGAPS
jgi:hypothetical protein